MNTEHAFRGRRLFVAIDLPEHLRERLARLQEPLKGFNWVTAERLHLTLKFIGDVPGQFQPEIERALDTFHVGSFILPVQGVGCFPCEERAHAVWVGLGNGHPRLFQLHKRINDALFAIGIEPDRHVFQPHVTIARVNAASHETVRQFLKRHREFEAAPFRPAEFGLYHSLELDGHRHYALQKAWPLQDHPSESQPQQPGAEAVTEQSAESY